MPASNFISATDVRKNLFKLLNKVKKSSKLFIVVHKGQPVAVLLGWKRYNELNEK